ncbi:Laminin N-terminal (Domain VI) [Popillia japonica]|uniref:Laminin N-terminal (Domain VI) n=1 Tax=Popillia japonica TaxID=7064 RepID=A0AAW1MZZ8_POPJA
MTRIEPFSPSTIISTIAAVLICNFILSTSGEYRDRYRVNPRASYVLRGDQPPPPDIDGFESIEGIHPLTDLSVCHFKSRG